MAINKRVFLTAINCPTFSWKEAHITSDQPSDEDYERTLKILEGNEIGDKARTTFPDGVLVSERDVARAIQITNQLLGKGDVKVLFEATFQSGNFIAKADILIRNDDNTFNLIEVKSSVNDKPELVDDLTYTAMVLKLTKLNVRNYALMLLSKDFRLGMNVTNMFKLVDHTSEVIIKIEEMMQQKDLIEQNLLSEKEPKAVLGGS